MLKINGKKVATPKYYEVTINDLDGESNRNANGELVRDRIGVKRKINLEWPLLSQSEISTLLTSVSSVFFSVTFYDPQAGEITKTMYVGDRTAPANRIVNGQVMWSGLKMNFIEK
ncbi:MAG: hypothetical protein HUJ77_12215 [Clostridium sp.]|uniref:DUF6711 family protein n=1 Tax=Clostridium sp. TaxID=1506 RepID=UPI0025BB1728|nr:DUF6711 family protein [Clostridium sp.]MCF0149146.1 hypothetical protein [Clostridium sp.]